MVGKVRDLAQLDGEAVCLDQEWLRSSGLDQDEHLVVDHADGGLLLIPARPDAKRLYLEPTSRCNLACAACMRHAWDEPPGDMSDETFAAIVAQSAGPAAPGDGALRRLWRAAHSSAHLRDASPGERARSAYRARPPMACSLTTSGCVWPSRRVCTPSSSRSTAYRQRPKRTPVTGAIWNWYSPTSVGWWRRRTRGERYCRGSAWSLLLLVATTASSRP